MVIRKSQINLEDFGKLVQKVDDIKDDVTEIKRLLTENYVTKSEFTPVKNLVYGVVSLILVSFVGALITLVLRK